MALKKYKGVANLNKTKKSNRLHREFHKPTLGDVALAAGVSTATVSRVINNSGPVKNELKVKIEQQIIKLGYVRDGAARALASNTTRMIGAIIPTLDNAIFASGIHALQKQLNQAGYTLMLSVSNYDQHQELKQIREIMEQGVDGILLVGSDHLPESYALLAQHQQLFANMWTFEATSLYPSIGFDNFKAAEKIARYLVELGHRKFALISGIVHGNDRAKARIAGVQKVLDENGIFLDEADIIECKYDLWEGRHATRNLLNRPTEDRPTAIICGNDVLAFGCLAECKHLGIAVPLLVSVTGFDNLPISEHLSPSLTTINVPSMQMGDKAGRFIVNKLAGRKTESKVEVATQLIIRESTGKAVEY